MVQVCNEMADGAVDGTYNFKPAMQRARDDEDQVSQAVRGLLDLN